MITFLATAQNPQKKPLLGMCEVNLSNKYGPSMCIGRWCICLSPLDRHQNWGNNMYIQGNALDTRLLLQVSNVREMHMWQQKYLLKHAHCHWVNQASDKQKDRCPWIIHTTFHKWHHARIDGTSYALLGESYTIDEQK
jgi:hypothetical protein